MKYFEAGFFIQLYNEAGGKTVRLTNENALYSSVQALKDDFIALDALRVEFFSFLLIWLAALNLLSFLIFIFRINCRRRRSRTNSKKFKKPLEIVIYDSP